MLIDIRLRFARVPAKWELRGVSEKRGKATFAFPTAVASPGPNGYKVFQLDASAYLDQLLDMQEGDDKALVRFLNKTGVFFESDGRLVDHWSREVLAHSKRGNPRAIDTASVWALRRALRAALLDPKSFRETRAARFIEETEIDLIRSSGMDVFSLRFELAKLPIGAITVTNTYDALLAATFLEAASGVEYRKCLRDGCGKIFRVGVQRTKVNCSDRCKHLTTVWRKRPNRGRLRTDGRTGACSSNQRTQIGNGA